MLLSNTTEVLNTRLSDAEAIQFMAEAGFDAFDMSFMHMTDHDEHPLNQPHYREYALELRKIADEAGIICNQAHVSRNLTVLFCLRFTVLSNVLLFWVLKLSSCIRFSAFLIPRMQSCSEKGISIFIRA